MKLEVYIGYDHRTGLTYFVDSLEKLPRRIRSISLKSKPLDLAHLKALVYDTERLKEKCVVDVDGWIYDTEKAARLVQRFPLFTVTDRPADEKSH
jgi:hypothetical protein